MIASSIIGFAPAVFLLFILLRRYEEFFKEKKIFQAFAGGMILGMIFTIAHMASDDFLLSALDLSFIGFVILFAAFEEGAKLVILNLPRLQLKHETVYYGAALGLGIGSMAIIAISFKVFLDDPSAIGNPLTILGLVVLSFNFSLLHSATGVIIGYGSAKGEGMKWFFRAAVLHAAYNLVLLPFMWGIEGALFGSLFVATLVALGLFLFVLRDLMPDAVPPEMQKKRRREVRRRAREERDN
jgi:RsiW-degrading membrane proteinase PrsW (M82 family)